MPLISARICRPLVAAVMMLPAWPQEAPKDASRTYIPMRVEDVMLHQSKASDPPVSASQRMNERLTELRRDGRSATDYLLGPGDEIEVSVIGVPALNHKAFALDARGRISLPYVEEVDLLGKTARQAEARIAELFGESLLESAEVSVSVKSYKSQSFYVFGAVVKPGACQLAGDTNLLDALTLAGGLTDRAGTHIQIHRAGEAAREANPAPAPASGGPRAKNPAAGPGLNINLTDLLDRGNMSLNVPIRSGDVITVQEKEEKFIYVLGDVQKPGAYAVRKAERMTLARAIANAGGVLPTSSGKKTRIMRPRPDGITAEQFTVNAISVIKGEAPDFDLAENDVILVPGSASKTLSKSFMGSLGSLMTTLLWIGIR